MSNTRTITPAAQFKAVSGLRVKGDRYGHAGIAGLAALILLRMEGDNMQRGAAAKLVEGTGYDKGTVSRVKGVLVKSSAARAAVTGLDVTGIEKSAASLAAAVTTGELFKRPAAVKGAGKGKGGDVDILALFTADLEGATDKQFAARVAQYVAVIERVKAERAAKSAGKAAA